MARKKKKKPDYEQLYKAKIREIKLLRQQVKQLQEIIDRLSNR
jgi:division protein CdvB (Snf7/Vps24/ESCRT-III family)